MSPPSPPSNPYCDLAQQDIPRWRGRTARSERAQEMGRLGIKQRHLGLLEEALSLLPRHQRSTEWPPACQDWLRDAMREGWKEGVAALLRQGALVQMDPSRPWWEVLAARDDVGMFHHMLDHGVKFQGNGAQFCPSRLAGAPNLIVALLQRPELHIPMQAHTAWMQLALDHRSPPELAEQLNVRWKADPADPSVLYNNAGAREEGLVQLWKNLTASPNIEEAQRALRLGWGPPPNLGTNHPGISWVWRVVECKNWPMFHWVMRVPALQETWLDAARKYPDRTVLPALLNCSPGERNEWWPVLGNTELAQFNKDGRTLAGRVLLNNRGELNRQMALDDLDWWMKLSPAQILEGSPSVLGALTPAHRARATKMVFADLVPVPDTPSRPKVRL